MDVNETNVIKLVVWWKGSVRCDEVCRDVFHSPSLSIEMQRIACFLPVAVKFQKEP